MRITPLLSSLLVGLCLAAPLRAEEPPLPEAAPRATVIPLEIAKPAGHVHIPQSKADVAVGPVVPVALNKTLPLDLPIAARDIIVGNPAIAEVMVRSPHQVFVMGKALGDTNLFFLDAGGQLIRRVEIHVGPDAEGARAAIAQMLPDDVIAVTTVGDSLFLSGKVRNEQAAANARTVARRFVAADANLVNQLMVLGAQQVLLRVRVSEVARTVVKDLGFTTSFTNSATSKLQFNAVQGGSTTFTDAAAASGSILFKPAGLNFDFQALESHGLLRTLAEPNLSAVSGEVAKLLAGGEIPIPVSQTNGAISVEYKPYGVGLVFSPVVLNNGRISLKVQSEVSQIDPNNKVGIGNGVSVPAFLVRRAETVVEVPSGGSLMIAGLLQNSGNSSLAGLPGAKDLPIIGALLGSTAFNNNESELMVTVTPYLVEPTDAKTLSLPTDGFIPSSDLKRYFLMRLQETYGNAPPTVALQGPVGPIVE
jgi:pilus assembly protein CpaC